MKQSKIHHHTISLKMKYIHYIPSVVLLAVLSTTCAKAQDTLATRNVTVQREYKPVIQDAGKISFSPNILELKVDKSKPRYTDFNLPLTLDNNIHTLSAAQPENGSTSINGDGYLRVGIGTYLNTLLDFAYPLIKTDKSHLDLSINHLGAFSEKAHSITNLNLQFDQNFASLDFFTGLKVGHEYFKYYGSSYNNNDSVIHYNKMPPSLADNVYTEQNTVLIGRDVSNITLGKLANSPSNDNLWRVNFYGGIRSTNAYADWRYQLAYNYNHFSSRIGLSEVQNGIAGDVNKLLVVNRAGLKFEFTNLNYSNDTARFNFWKSYSVLSINPYYAIDNDELSLKLGAKLTFSLQHGSLINPSPDVEVEWKAAPDYLTVYGGATGGVGINTQNRIFAENPYLFSDTRVKDTFTPIDIYAGLKLKPIYGLFIDAFTETKIIHDQYFFVNKKYYSSTMATADSVIYANRFDVIYSDALKATLGIRANYNLQGIFNFEIAGKYNYWKVSSETYAWNQPKYEMNFGIDYKIHRNLQLSASGFVETGRFAKLGDKAIEMDPVLDLNLGASYSYDNWMSIFLKGNNLLNRKYQHYYGYDVQGLNVMGGVVFSF